MEDQRSKPFPKSNALFFGPRSTREISNVRRNFFFQIIRPQTSLVRRRDLTLQASNKHKLESLPPPSREQTLTSEKSPRTLKGQTAASPLPLIQPLLPPKQWFLWRLKFYRQISLCHARGRHTETFNTGHNLYDEEPLIYSSLLRIEQIVPHQIVRGLLSNNNHYNNVFAF